MKAYIIYIATALALLTAAGGCSDDLTSGDTAGSSILTFGATIAPMTGATPTRATVEGNFPDGARIGVFVRNGGATTEKVYVYNSSTRQFIPATPADAVHWQGTPDETISITAWYPYPYIPLGVFTALPADQRSDEAFANADFLICYADIVRDTPATLTFQHCHSALITVNLSAGTGISEAALSRATVTLPSCATDQVSIDRGLVMLMNPVSTGVNAHKRTPSASGDMPAFDAIVRKYIFEVGETSELIRVTIDGTDYSYYKPVEASFAFEEGYHYTYNVRVNDDGLTLEPPAGGTWKPAGEPENITSTPSNNP